MEYVYADLIKDGLMTIDDVPSSKREATLALLEGDKK